MEEKTINTKITELEAALGVAQLEHSNLQAMRRILGQETTNES